MSHELLLNQLRLAVTSEQKAALVAEAIIGEFPEPLAKTAIRCSFLPWFSDEIIMALHGDIKNDQRADSIINLIVRLPFVERLSWGYCFHSTTRRGILNKYVSENPAEILLTFDLVEKLLSKGYEGQLLAQLALLYGYVLTNQGAKAEDYFLKVLKKITDFETFSDLEEAEEFCNLKNVGLTPMYWLFRSQFYLIAGKYEQSINVCNNALALDDKHAQALATRGYAYARLGEPDKALRDANLAVQLDQNEDVFRIRASVHLLQKEFKKAIFDFTRAIRINPKDVFSYLGRAQTYVAKQQPEKSLKDLNTAITLSGDSDVISVIYFEYAYSLIGTRQWQESLMYLDKSIELLPTSGAYRRKGDLLVRLSRYDDALIAYDISISLNDRNPYAFLGRGKVHLNEGMYQEALQDFETALSLPLKHNLMSYGSFDFDEVFLRFWEVYLLQGNKVKAKKQKETLLNKIEKLDQLYEVSFFCRKYQEFETLLEVSLRLTDLDKKNEYGGDFAAGYALNMLGRYNEALVFFEKGREGHSAELYYINSGLSYWGLGDYYGANERFEKAHLELHKRSRFVNIRNSTKTETLFEGKKVWLKLMLGNPDSAMKEMISPSWKKSADLNDLYNFRDWCSIVGTSSNKPSGFNDFIELVENSLIELGDKEIYKLVNGV